MTLRERVLRAGGWSAAGFAFSQAIRFGSSLLMTRLLVPEMFGVMAIATVVMAGLAMFSDLGLRQGIVQSRRGDDVVFLNTAWAVQILRGVAICALALLVSALLYLAGAAGVVPAGSVYAAPILPYVVAVVSVNAVVAGFESTKSSQASRALALGRVTQIELAAQAGGVAFMLAWAAFDRSVWTLVAGGIFATAARTVLTHLWLPGVANRWQWDRNALHDIVHFGKWIFASSILGFLVNNGDRLLLGALLDASVLGVYVIAVLVLGSVEQVLSKIISDVSFPALSETVRDRREQLATIYYRFHLAIGAVGYFAAGALMVAGQALIDLLYDPRYSDAGWMIEILAIGLLSVPFRVAGLCLVALGMPRLLSHVIAARLLAMVIAMPAGFRLLGVEGALWGLVLSHGVYIAVTLAYKTRFALLDWRKELPLLGVLPAGAAAGWVLDVVLGQ